MLQLIRTFGQSFSNTPNEKFLLMILGSQAKLENDNRGVNVKRGIRTVCEQGWRPCRPPLGYYNQTIGSVKDVILDPERHHDITEMFHRVANGESGLAIQKWFDEEGLTTRAGKRINFSVIYNMLNNPFYYGESNTEASGTRALISRLYPKSYSIKQERHLLNLRRVSGVAKTSHSLATSPAWAAGRS